jgi:hypothetical protein
MSVILTGFYRCTDCQRLHTYSPGFTVVHCACGAIIDQLTRNQT